MRASFRYCTRTKKYGYRTLAEVLGAVRGFYSTNDRMYEYSGTRGISIPGDFNSRYLVMLNGHPLTENVYDSNNFFGQDFGLDMDLVERIEIVRGPNSALYGSNGIFANINVITKSPVDMPRVRVNTETGSFGEKKIFASSSMDLGKGANLLIAASVFNNSGRSLYFPDYDRPETDNGIATRVDAQRGYHTLANLVWGRWSFMSYFNSHEIHVPGGGGGCLFNDQGSRVRDGRNLVGATYTRELGNSVQLRWQTYYERYRYNDRWDYALEDGQIEDNRTGAWGDWINSQLTASLPAGRLGTLTLGIQGNVELRNLQTNEDVSPEPIAYTRIDARDRSAAVFAQQEWSIAPHWKAYLGLRLDESRNFGNFLSPRVALVHQPSQKTSVKLVYGHPFRNPSAFEKYYKDNVAFLDNPSLTRETTHAFELSVERKLRPDLTVLINPYLYKLSNVVESVWVSDVMSQYVNSGIRRSAGVEFEIKGSPAWWLEAMASYTVQKTSAGVAGQSLPNSPAQIGKTRLAVPLVRNRVYLSSALQYVSARMTAGQGLVRPVLLADATVTTNRLFRDYDLAFGIRNALNWQYDQPVDLSMNRIRANGRSIVLKLIWQRGE